MSVKLTLFGGGGFRTPLVYAALLQVAEDLDIAEVVLHDVDADRLRLMRAVTTGLARERGGGPRVTVTTDTDTAADGADVVFCAIRVGGLTGRVVDERVPVDLGIVGQETTGPGGIAKALRTIPVTDAIARAVTRRAPNAWFVNFTNPAGVVTESLRDLLGDRVVGVCDTPSGLCGRVAAVLGRDPDELHYDYAGLNHLGWLTGVRDGANDLLPALLADDRGLRGLAEARLFGTDRLRTLGAVPNEYLAYYDFNRRIADTLRRGTTRGEYLLRQQRAFYATATEDPAAALTAWRRAALERTATYLAEVEPTPPPRDDRAAKETEHATAGDAEHDGYGAVAIGFVRAVRTGAPTVSILNVANRSAVPFLPADAVIEVPCVVTSAGPAPLSAGRLPPEPRELVETVKAVERLTIRAARTGSADLAVRALALHPLVPSEHEAHRLLDGYLARHAALRELFRSRP